MKVGVDHYSYHRFFGEVYPQQKAPDKKMTVEQYIRRCAQMGCDGLTLESCFMPRFDKDYLAALKGLMDEHKMDRVYGWGHPDGLEGGKNKKAFAEMIQHIEYAAAVGAKVMKVTGASLMFRFEPHAPMIERLSRMYSEAVKVAKKYDIKLATENHIDFVADEMLTLIKNVNSPNLGINFDTGNFLRLLDDPIKGMKKLAKYVLSTHVKDLKPQKGVAADEWFFFSCTPVGDGMVDNRAAGQGAEGGQLPGFPGRGDRLPAPGLPRRRGQGGGAERAVPEEDQRMKTMNVAIIGDKFMGKAHSNAWKQAPYFFDIPIQPVLKVACGRNAEQLKAFRPAVGLGGGGDRLAQGRRAQGHRHHRRFHPDLAAPRHRDRGGQGRQAHLLREADGHQLPGGQGDVPGRQGGQGQALHQLQLPALSGDSAGQAPHRRGQDRPHLPLARGLPAVLDHGPDLPADLAPAQGHGGGRARSTT